MPVNSRWDLIRGFKGKCTVLLTKYCPGDQIENEMGGACSTDGGEERCVQGVGGET